MTMKPRLPADTLSEGEAAEKNPDFSQMTRRSAIALLAGMTHTVQAAPWRMAPGPHSGAPVISAVLMGQSELAYLTRPTSNYRQIAQPRPGPGNLKLYLHGDTPGGPVYIREVNEAAVNAGEINPAMAALSAFLHFAAPGRTFVLGDGHVPGTSRSDLADDSTDDSDGRLWADFANVFDAMERDGTPAKHLIECWYNSGAAHIPNFVNSYWPFYFGAHGDGGKFTLGTEHGVLGRQVDHCIWDAHAAPSAKGRGLLARAGSHWHILTPMPFHNAPPLRGRPDELGNFSENNARLTEPGRAVMTAVAGNALAQTVDIAVGPSAHLCDFGGGIHPVTKSPDGQILFMWPLALAMLRAAGRTIHEPVIQRTEGPDSGEYVDVVVSLPNGGKLTTLAALERRAAYDGKAPHQQAVTGFEMTRGSARRPVHRPTETAYPQSHRGTVAIVDAGSGNPRVGKVRITPETPFAFGDSLSYLRGQGTAVLLEPRDLGLYPYFLLEHVPALHDAQALYPFPGVAVRPYQADLPIRITPPPFEPNAVHFDGKTYFSSQAIDVQGSNSGMASFWIRPDEYRSGQTVFEFRAGRMIVLSAALAGRRRMLFRLPTDVSTTIFSVPADRFPESDWAHVLWSWDHAAGRFQVYVNGVAVVSRSHGIDGGKFLVNNRLQRVGIGASPTGSAALQGGMGHLYINLAESLDFRIPANRAKFAIAGAPADLGASGKLPTGNTPAYYYDGAGMNWSNKGSAGNITLAGTLTATGQPLPKRRA